MQVTLSHQHFCVQPRCVHVNTPTDARAGAWANRTRTRTGERITAMENREMQQARLMLRQDWKQGPTRVCLENCWGLSAFNDCYKAISRSCSHARWRKRLVRHRLSCMPGDLPEKGGDYEMNSACKGEASTGTRWGRWVRGTDSLCLRCGGTLRGMPWNEPCQGEKEGAEYPPCAERERGRSIIKKENREKQDTKKPHHSFSFSPRKVSLYFSVVLFCKSKRYTLPKPRWPKLVRNLTKYLHFYSIYKHTFLSKIVLGEKYRSWAFHDKNTW